MALGGIRAWAGEDGDGKTLYEMEISRFNFDALYRSRLRPRPGYMT